MVGRLISRAAYFYYTTYQSAAPLNNESAPMAIYADHDHLRYVLLAYIFHKVSCILQRGGAVRVRACESAYVYVRILTVQT